MKTIPATKASKQFGELMVADSVTLHLNTQRLWQRISRLGLEPYNLLYLLTITVMPPFAFGSNICYHEPYEQCRKN